MFDHHFNCAAHHAIATLRYIQLQIVFMFFTIFLNLDDLSPDLQEEGAEYPPAMKSVLAKLLPLASGISEADGGASAKLHWRFIGLANTLLLLLLPPPTGHDAAAATQHLASLLPSQLPAHQSIGMAGLVYLLDRDVSKHISVRLLLHLCFVSLLTALPKISVSATLHIFRAAACNRPPLHSSLPFTSQHQK